jgi:transposase-like protein
MITTIQLCGRCSSEHVRNNGSNGGRAKYQCTSCGYQGYVQPAAPARAARYAQVEKLLAERTSQCSIVRATGVSRMTVAKLAKKSGASSPGTAAPTAEKSATQTLGSAGTR